LSTSLGASGWIFTSELSIFCCFIARQLTCAQMIRERNPNHETHNGGPFGCPEINRDDTALPIKVRSKRDLYARCTLARFPDRSIDKHLQTHNLHRINSYRRRAMCVVNFGSARTSLQYRQPSPTFPVAKQTKSQFIANGAIIAANQALDLMSLARIYDPKRFRSFQKFQSPVFVTINFHRVNCSRHVAKFNTYQIPSSGSA